VFAADSAAGPGAADDDDAATLRAERHDGMPELDEPRRRK
jgi:hypothetical protein